VAAHAAKASLYDALAESAEGGRSDLGASSLLTGDQSALGVAAVPWGLLSLGCPRVPFLFLRGICWGPGVEDRPPKRGIPAGQRPVAMVGVTGFEPAASSSRTSRNRNHGGG